MPNQGTRGIMKEMNNYPQGRSGSETKKMMGPAVGNTKQGNPTMSGGINRATKPTRQN